MPSCSANNANLDKNNFDIFYKIDCRAAIHGWKWMNNVPNESRIIMLSCTEISFVISFFDFLKFGVKPGFPFKKHLTLYTQAGVYEKWVLQQDQTILSGLRLPLLTCSWYICTYSTYLPALLAIPTTHIFIQNKLKQWHSLTFIQIWISLHISLFIYLFIYLLIYSFIHSCINLSINFSIYLFIHSSIYSQ